ncbi:hypothetical protein QMK33_03085 [Hymenobacter sp. H14-R3]|uniref:hypothetical protein n=1 Tax=Hymenobacter sp. H14-R3 TaxID=3046308 RepID=UPI0024B8F121|nr:hypothetical protein [Hymenobacter sp. H14-R3]MDJ0364122.1 hypothetical protein [Hymenobacter sp. H14-R3]
MKAEVAQDSIRKGKRPADADWYSGFTGLFSLSALWFMSACYLLETSGTSFALVLFCFLTLGTSFFYGLYNLFTERNLISVTTGLNATRNTKLLQDTFNKLGWQWVKKGDCAVSAVAPHEWYAIHYATIICLITDDTLYLNALSSSNSKGRLPLFRSKNNYFMQLVSSAIKKELACLPETNLN